MQECTCSRQHTPRTSWKVWPCTTMCEALSLKCIIHTFVTPWFCDAIDPYRMPGRPGQSHASTAANCWPCAPQIPRRISLLPPLPLTTSPLSCTSIVVTRRDGVDRIANHETKVCMAQRTFDQKRPPPDFASSPQTSHTLQTSQTPLPSHYGGDASWLLVFQAQQP